MFRMVRFSDPKSVRYQFAFRCYESEENATQEFWAAVVWCTDLFGPPSGAKAERWDRGAITIWFRDEADAFQFKLRWC